VRYVKTDYDGCSYITADKVYKLFNEDHGYGEIFNDSGEMSLIVVGYGCAHLDRNGSWIECDADGNELETK